MTHHPHVHTIEPGGGISLDGAKWIACRRNFLVHFRVLSRLFRQLFLEKLVKAHDGGLLKFYGRYADLTDRAVFDAFLKRPRKAEWYVRIKGPFAGPRQVLAYLSRYTHHVAISNRRLIKPDSAGVTFRYKDYRVDGQARYQTMTLEAHEFIRRFLMHVLPKGLHRIRHYGLFANGNRAANIARARELLNVPAPNNDAPDGTRAEPDQPQVLNFPCPSCGGRMIIIEVVAPGMEPKYQPSPEAIDSS